MVVDTKKRRLDSDSVSVVSSKKRSSVLSKDLVCSNSDQNGLENLKESKKGKEKNKQERQEEEKEEEDDDDDEEEEEEEDGYIDEIEMIQEPKDVRRKIPIKYIENKTRRQVTFAKRRHGIMKKAYELSVLTGVNILLLILGHSGLVYTFSTPKLEPIIREDKGKELIRKCLNSQTTTTSSQQKRKEGI